MKIIHFINNPKIIRNGSFLTSFTFWNIWRTKKSLNSFFLYFIIFNHHEYYTMCIYVCHVSVRDIFLYAVVQSYFAIISREWCFSCDMNVISSVRERSGRRKLKKYIYIWEMRIILFGKNIIEREWTVGCWKRYIEFALLSNESRQRIRYASFGPSDAFTLQRCYRISRRRCNRRCNLCLILSRICIWLKIYAQYMYIYFTSVCLTNLFHRIKFPHHTSVKIVKLRMKT